MPPEVKALLKERGPRAIARLAELVESEDGKIAIAAANSIADRAYGKATQPIEGTEDGPAVRVDVGVDVARSELAALVAKLTESSKK